MKNLDRMKGTLIIFLGITLTLLSACSSPSGENPKAENIEKKEVKQEAQKPEQKVAEKKLARPRIGQVKEFFLEYGKNNPETEVLLMTRLGDIEIRLYEETPIHRANFIYNVKEELYHQTIFYRVVPKFMIQGGNSDYDQTLEKREEAGSYYIPNESQQELIHKRGTIAMAMSYDDNPELKSAQYSYYIVIGTPFSDNGLDAVEKEYEITIPESSREVYRTEGGTPHLDGVHTVFGEVIEGMDVVEAISNEKRDSGDWPVNDVIIDYKVLK